MHHLATLGAMTLVCLLGDTAAVRSAAGKAAQIGQLLLLTFDIAPCRVLETRDSNRARGSYDEEHCPHVRTLLDHDAQPKLLDGCQTRAPESMITGSLTIVLRDPRALDRDTEISSHKPGADAAPDPSLHRLPQSSSTKRASSPSPAATAGWPPSIST